MVKKNDAVVIIGVDYDEFDPSSYRGVTIDYGGKRTVLKSGFPAFDRLCAEKAARVMAGDGYAILFSSSWDHFVSDSEEEHPDTGPV